MAHDARQRPHDAEVRFDPQALASILRGLPRRGPYLLACSGGLDSTVLLAALAKLRGAGQPVDLRVIHVNHGLLPQSGDWSEHCQRQCERLGLAFHAHRVDARAAPGASPEAAARQARYAAFETELRRDEVLLTAQHCDDQVETVLLRLLRGAGTRGLQGMPAWRRLGVGYLARPLLRWRRQALLDWARAEGLEWLNDPSNGDPRYDRNYLRGEILPRLRRRFGGFERPLLRAADNLRDADDLLGEVADADLEALDDGESLDLDGLRALGGLRRANALRQWLSRRGPYAPERDALHRMLELFLDARIDAQPCMRLASGELRRYRGRLFYLSEVADTSPWRCAWDGVTPFLLPATGRRVSAAELRAEGLELPPGATLEFRSRPPGLRLRLRGKRHTRSLKRLLQESPLPPWRRARIGVLYAAGRPLWVEALGIVDDFVEN